MTKHLLLLGLMIAAGAASADPLVGGDAKAGQQRAAACAACHGPKGNMESDQFPKLAGQGSPYIYEQLKLFKSGERNNAIMMGQASGLSDKDMKNVAAYYSAQQTRPGVASEKIAPAGATLYHGGQSDQNIPACAGCHGPAGVGNAAAKFPRLSGQNPQYIVTQLTAYREGERSGYRNATIMNGVAQNLSDADIKALASYVSGLSPATGESGNNHGALMQNVSGPAKAGSGASGGNADSGQSAQGNSAEDGSEDAGDAAASSDSAGKPADSASGGDQPASGDSEDGAGQKAAAQDSGTGKDRSASSVAEPDNAGAAKTGESADAEDEETGGGGESGTASGTATSAPDSGSDSAGENADQAKQQNPEDKNSGDTGASPQ